MRSLHNYSPRKPNGYSAKNILKPIPFVCLAPEAQQVFITGDFNDWDAAAHPRRSARRCSWR